MPPFGGIVYSSLFSVSCSVTMGGCTLLSSSPLSRGKDGGGCAHPLFFVSGAPALAPAFFAWLPLPCLSALPLALHYFPRFFPWLADKPPNLPPATPANFPTSRQIDKPISRKANKPTNRQAGKLATTPPTPYLPPPDSPHARTRPSCLHPRRPIVPVHHTSFLSPCCTASSPLSPPFLPPFSVPAPCPPNAATPHTPLPPILPTPSTRARCVLPLCTPPVTVTAQCSHCTLLSLHLAITSSGLPANFPTLQVSDFPTSRKANKSESRQVGKLASAPPPGSTARPRSHHHPPRTGGPRVSW